MSWGAEGGVGGHSSQGLGTHGAGVLQELVAVGGIHWHLGGADGLKLPCAQPDS